MVKLNCLCLSLKNCFSAHKCCLTSLCVTDGKCCIISAVSYDIDTSISLIPNIEQKHTLNIYAFLKSLFIFLPSATSRRSFLCISYFKIFFSFIIAISQQGYFFSSNVSIIKLAIHIFLPYIPLFPFFFFFFLYWNLKKDLKFRLSDPVLNKMTAS